MVEVPMQDLVPNNHYMVRCEGFDEDEQPVKYTDVVWVDLSSVPGQGKKSVRQIRFCRFPRVLTLMQVVGCKFYGPLEFDLSGESEQEDAVVAQPALAQFLTTR